MLVLCSMIVCCEVDLSKKRNRRRVSDDQAAKNECFMEFIDN